MRRQALRLNGRKSQSIEFWEAEQTSAFRHTDTRAKRTDHSAWLNVVMTTPFCERQTTGELNASKMGGISLSICVKSCNFAHSNNNSLGTPLTLRRYLECVCILTRLLKPYTVPHPSFRLLVPELVLLIPIL